MVFVLLKERAVQVQVKCSLGAVHLNGVCLFYPVVMINYSTFGFVLIHKFIVDKRMLAVSMALLLKTYKYQSSLS